MLLWISIGVAGVALGVLLWAVRGRRVDDHPLCRRCGYDLSGAAVAGALSVCSECGADVSRGGRAVRVGHRRSRPRAAALSGSALAVALFVVGGERYVAMRKVNLNVYKPAWILVNDFRGSTDPNVWTAAFAELAKRLDAGGLTASSAQGLAEAVIARQADRTIAWDPAWGGAVERAASAGLLAPGQLARYWGGAVDWNVELLIRRVPDVPMTINVYQPRASRHSGAPFAGDFRLRSMRVHGVEVDCGGFGVTGRLQLQGGVPGFAPGSRWFVGTASGDRELPFRRAPADAAPPGATAVTLTFDLTVTSEEKGPSSGPVHTTSTVAVPVDFPGGALPVGFTGSAEDTEGVKRGLAVKRLVVTEGAGDNARRFRVELELSCAPPPTDVVYAVTLRRSNRDVVEPLGWLVCRAGQPGEARITRDWLRSTGATADLVFTPDPFEAARRGIPNVLGHPITLTGVPVVVDGGGR
jgi:hypothetical protein